MSLKFSNHKSTIQIIPCEYINLFQSNQLLIYTNNYFKYNQGQGIIINFLYEYLYLLDINNTSNLIFYVNPYIIAVLV